MRVSRERRSGHKGVPQISRGLFGSRGPVIDHLRRCCELLVKAVAWPNPCSTNAALAQIVEAVIRLMGETSDGKDPSRPTHFKHS